MQFSNILIGQKNKPPFPSCESTHLSQLPEGVSSNSHITFLFQVGSVQEKIDGPGLYVFKHKEHQCFQFVGRADRIFARVGEKLKASFEGGLTEPLAALLIISMSTDWDFYFMPVDLDGRYGHGDYIDCHHETN